MNQFQLQELINQKLSTYEIAIQLQTSQTNIRYWLNKFNLKTKRARKSYEDNFKLCFNCSKELPLNQFHKNKNNKTHGLSSYCKTCNTTLTIKRQREFKIQCLEYKGCKCERCGYSKSIRALEFHHEDQTQKDFDISRAKLKIFNDSIKKELDKCLLLCANCHREEHDRLYSEPG
jgi:hypothetical protein